jgi:hypothetical protein
VIGDRLESSDKVLAIGNGESRKNIDLNYFSDYMTVGCNAICREYDVDHLICVDRRMVKEAIGTQRTTPVYTRKDWIGQFNKFSFVLPLPELPYQGDKRSDEPFHWGSGPYAVLLSAILGNEISLIGFDLWSATGKVNNIYKGTDNYVAENYRAVDPSYWLHQISMVFRSFPDKYFIVYNNKGWLIPEDWKLDNVVIKDLDFINQIR